MSKKFDFRGLIETAEAGFSGFTERGFSTMEFFMTPRKPGSQFLERDTIVKQIHM
jgi:hypothetical protein